MKFIRLGCVAMSIAGVVLMGCGSAGSGDGSSSEDSLLTSSATPANTIMKINPNAPTLTSRKPTASAAGADGCGPREHACELANDKGICVERCVPAGVMCVAPNCVVCDPAGPRPNPACTWDSEECQWDCPVCDPSGPAPEPGCKWDSKACVWLCL